MTTTLTSETTKMTATTTAGAVNGVNVPVVMKLLEDVKRDALRGATHWEVTTAWKGGTISETKVTGCGIGGKRVNRAFSFRSDEPLELGGTNQHPNPQELLLGALNACMTVGYVALSSLMGIEMESVEIQTEGDIDLRGFLGLDKSVKAGYDELRYTVRIKGNGTPEQFQTIHETVMATSPNRFNISQPVRLKGELVVG
jgi:uncharacterized OsmC-like protein